MEDFGKFIANQRDSKKMSQQELADAVRLNRSTLAAIETGAIKKVDPDLFNRLQEALGFDPLAGLWRQGYRVPPDSSRWAEIGPSIDPDLLELLARFDLSQQAQLADMVRAMGELLGLVRPARRTPEKSTSKQENRHRPAGG